MGELADVKIAVKSWERAFRRDHGRAPTKADISADTEMGESTWLESEGR